MPDVLESVDIARAWREPDYFGSLDDEQRAALPPNPVGELRAADLRKLKSSGESIAVSIISPAGCFFTFACTGSCCAG